MHMRSFENDLNRKINQSSKHMKGLSFEHPFEKVGIMEDKMATCVYFLFSTAKVC